MNRALALGAIASTLVILLEVYGLRTSALGRPEMWSLMYDLSLAYLASLVFYVVVVVVPRRQDRTHIYARVGPRLKIMIATMEAMVRTAMRVSGRDLDPSKATADEFSAMYALLDPNGEAPIVVAKRGGAVSHGSWALFHQEHIDKLRRLRQDIMEHLPYLDTRLVQLINAFDDSGLFHHEFFFKNVESMGNRTLEVIGPGVWESYRAMQDIAGYCQKDRILRASMKHSP